MDCSTPGLRVYHRLPKLAQTHVHRVSDDIQPSHPLLSPSLPAFNLSQHQGLFKWVNSLHQVAKVLELQHQSFQWIFRTDFLQDGLVGSPWTPRDSQESSPHTNKTICYIVLYCNRCIVLFTQIMQNKQNIKHFKYYSTLPWKVQYNISYIVDAFIFSPFMQSWAWNKLYCCALYSTAKHLKAQPHAEAAGERCQTWELTYVSGHVNAHSHLWKFEGWRFICKGITVKLFFSTLPKTPSPRFNSAQRLHFGSNLR